MNKQALKRSIDEWQVTYRVNRAQLLTRATHVELPGRDFALALVGVRRSGKTFTAMAITREIPEDRVLYYNFEDPIFYGEPKVENLELLLRTAVEFSPDDFEVLILDELQNVPGWERWLRKLIDQKRYRIVITGSSAKLLSGELGTSLTGRAIQHEVWPLAYREFLTFDKRSPASLPQHLSELRKFMQWGGFPEVVKLESEEVRAKLLSQYLSDIILKDILSRTEIRNKRALDQVIYFYLTNLSSLSSYSSMRKAFGVSLDAVAEYARALQDAFLLFEVERFHPNLKVQSRDPKKIYTIDTGLRNVVSRSVQDDFGKLLENIVYIELRRRGDRIYYFKGKQEVDFVTVRRNKVVSAIQVCASDLSDRKTREREIDGLTECLRSVGLKSGIILNWDAEEKIKTNDGLQIEIIPAVRWLHGD